MAFFSLTKEHKGTIGKLYINQLACVLFSFMVSAFGVLNNFTMFFCGLLTIGFYWFLIYQQMWIVGGTDRIRVDGARIPKNLFTGLIIGFWTNLPGIILAFLNLIYYIGKFTPLKFAGLAGRLIQYMYSLWWVMFFKSANILPNFLCPILTILVCGFGYYIGFHNFYLRTIIGFKPKTKNK